MMNTEEIKQTLINTREARSPGKPLKDNTLNNNTKMVLKLQSQMSDPNWLYDIDGIEKVIESYSTSTKKNYLSLVLQMVHSSDKEDYKNELVKKIQFHSQVKNSNEKQNIISPKKQEQKSMTMDDIDKLIELLLDNDNLKDAMILHILKVFPIRAEVGTLKLISKYRYDKIKGTMPKENYLVRNKNSLILSRNNYKTAEVYGRKEDKITGHLKEMLLDYIENNMGAGESVFGYSEQELSKRLSYISQKYIGTSLSVNAIAKINIEDGLTKIQDKDPMVRVNKIKSYLEKVGEIRGTSVQVLFNNYIN